MLNLRPIEILPQQFFFVKTISKVLLQQSQFFSRFRKFLGFVFQDDSIELSSACSNATNNLLAQLIKESPIVNRPKKLALQPKIGLKKLIMPACYQRRQHRQSLSSKRVRLCWLKFPIFSSDIRAVSLGLLVIALGVGTTSQLTFSLNPSQKAFYSLA